MARPRVFISSTFFDLRVLRADLDRFIREIGYEPILFEQGQVAYGKDAALEEYCYREINNCDILIAIIGGQYGSQSKDQKHSITQNELKTALERGKQVYIFVQKPVLNEYRTYQANKDLKGFKPVSVNDVRVFAIIEEIFNLPSNNPVEPFELSQDITRFLLEQWAGLFQRLLHETTTQKQIDIIHNLESTAKSLKELVTMLTDTSVKGDQAVKDILLFTHPAFSAVKDNAGIPYRVAFLDKEELSSLLSVRGFKEDKKPKDNKHYEWDNPKEKYGIRVNTSIFDDKGKLKIFKPQEWDNNWVKKYILPTSTMDDEIPF